MRRAIAIGLGGVFLAGSAPAQDFAGDREAGRAAWYSGHVAAAELPADPAGAPYACVGCHGTDGIALIEDAPHLAGETTIYIDSQLKAFQRGKRTHEIMTEIAAGMTDEEIRAAAEWYAAIGLVIEQVD